MHVGLETISEFSTPLLLYPNELMDGAGSTDSDLIPQQLQSTSKIFLFQIHH